MCIRDRPWRLLTTKNGYSKLVFGRKAAAIPGIHVIPMITISFNTIVGSFFLWGALVLPWKTKAVSLIQILVINELIPLSDHKSSRKWCGKLLKEIDEAFVWVCWINDLSSFYFCPSRLSGRAKVKKKTILHVIVFLCSWVSLCLFRWDK